MTETEIKALQEKVNKLHWWNQFDFGSGVMSNPPNDHKLYNRWLVNGLPERLDGFSVCDVGSYDGYWAYEAEKRGALPVLATDVWAKDPGSAGFDAEAINFVKQQLKTKFEIRQCSVYDLEKVGQYDIVTAMGVLYHLQFPFQAFKQLATVAKKHLILETEIACEDVSKPVFVFYPGTELGNDPTNWCSPNCEMLKALGKFYGFKEPRITWAHRVGATHAIARATFIFSRNNEPQL